MQKSQSSVIIAVVLATIVLLVAGYIVINSATNNLADKIPSASEVAKEINIPVAPVVNVPTASEIAAEIKVPSLKNDNLDDLLEGVYPNEVNDLENDCQNDLSDEFLDDLESDLQDLLEDELELDVEDVTVQDFNWDNEYNFDVDNLGINDEDVRAGSIYTILKVRYHEEFGDSDWKYAKVESRSSCADWDDNDNEFDDLESNYVLL